MPIHCSVASMRSSGGVKPKAFCLTYDDILKQVDTTGSIGDEIRLLIKRNMAAIETTPSEVNTGNNQITYMTQELMNGDEFCVQATFDGFGTIDEDCKTIPTPGLGFVPIS